MVSSIQLLILFAYWLGVHAAWFSSTKSRNRLAMLSVVLCAVLFGLLLTSWSVTALQISESMSPFAFQHKVSANAFSAAFVFLPFLLRAKSEIWTLLLFTAAIAMYLSVTVSLDSLISIAPATLMVSVVSTEESSEFVVVADFSLLLGWMATVLMGKTGRRDYWWSLISISAIVMLTWIHGVFVLSFMAFVGNIANVLVLSSIVYLPRAVIRFCSRKQVEPV